MTNKFQINRRTADKAGIALAMGYVSIPILIFFWGWLRPWIAVIGTLFFIWFNIKLFREMTENSECGFPADTRFSDKLLLFAGIALVWVYFSGIGGFTFQNVDHLVRNPIFRDLSEQKWPIIYDLSEESEAVQNICGDGKVAFSYYFCWWLPAALLSKIFGLGNNFRNALLLLWAVLGILEIFYLLCRKLKKFSWTVPFVMVFFSGLDIIFWLLQHKSGSFTFTNDLEWWAGFFQYSSNTTQLYWVFNQSIPVWLILAILLQLDSSEHIAALSSLVFAYSPWATFGMIPYALYRSVRDKYSLRMTVNVENICIPILMLIVFSAFYTAGTGGNGFIGTSFDFYSEERRRLLAAYIVFIFMEFGVYFIALGNAGKKYEYYRITLAELLIFPLIVIVDSNFTMRASIPALFLLAYYVIRFLAEENKENAIRKKALVAILCIGAVTPLCEINRSVSTSISAEHFTQEDIYSFADIQTDRQDLIELTKIQFFIYDYQNSAFFKYLAK